MKSQPIKALGATMVDITVLNGCTFKL